MNPPGTVALMTLVCLLMLGLASPARAVLLETKLTASDAAASDRFGVTVAISGNRALVGARANDDAGSNSGSAYLFNATTGSELFKLTASDAEANDAFGISVAISGNRALVGARNNIIGSGSAYLFDVSTGNQLLKLRASDAAPLDAFGHSVAISGNRAIVGAFDNDDAGSYSGSAYLFDVTTGNELAKLTASDAAEGDSFGWSVAISGNRAIVGAHDNDDAGIRSGSAYLFDVATGNELAKLTASDAEEGDAFGESVAISGSWAIVGAPNSDDAGTFSGSAYVFDVTTGNQLAKLTASDAAEGDHFGESVAISGKWAIVGATSTDVAGDLTGSAYVFDVTTGNQVAKLTSSDAAAGDRFSYSVAISGNRAIIGADLNDDAGFNSGSAYVYAPLPEPSSLTLCALGLAALALVARRPSCR